MNGGPIILMVFGKSQADHTQDQHRCGFGPRLICRHEAGKKLVELVGIFFGRHDIIPRLFVVGRRRPARRLKQGTEVSLCHGTLFETIRAPPVGQRRLDGIICHCLIFWV
jgi:hypothetical protein